MASRLTDAQIIAKKRLQGLIAAVVANAWHSLPHYDQAQVDQFLSTVLPLTAAANQQSVMLTEAFLSQALGRMPQGLDAGQIVAGIRNGAKPEEVYTRPFVAVWSALKRGTPWTQAVRIGLDRATTAAATDVQLSFTHTLRASAESTGGGGGGAVAYQRVPDNGACDFCQAAAGQIYHTSDLMPMHPHCGCGVEPLTGGSGLSFARTRFSGAGGLQVAVHDHGELGPTLTNAADNFSGPSAVANK